MEPLKKKGLEGERLIVSEGGTFSSQLLLDIITKNFPILEAKLHRASGLPADKITRY